ncbi:MAG: hypothetical protein K6E53_04215 [Lachnospiraceae bacterium]|nr:hypothetical protein [Lachnospiraceae bacterium]
MRRIQLRLSLFISVMLLVIAGALPVMAADKSDRNEGDAGKLRKVMEEDGMYVQKGFFREFDTVKLASEGKLLSCFGNNAGSAYLVFNLPAAPEQDTSMGLKERGWPDEIATEYDDPEVDNAPANPYFAPGGWEYKLRQDEAIVLITPLPEECKYYSFINYVMFTADKPGKNYEGLPGMFSVGNDETGIYHPIFGSIGNSLNMTSIKHSGDSEYGTEAVIVIGANKKVTDMVVKDLEAAGYDSGMINVMPIPSGTYHMGLEKGADTFSFLQRISQPKDKEAYEDYLKNISEESTVYRVTPQEEIDESPYENETVIPRGTGEHESAGLGNAEQTLDSIRAELIEKYSDEYDYEELSTEIAVPEGLTAYFTDFNAKGDNRDAMYLMTPEFTLDSDDDFIVTYGVNHTAAGKGIYSNAVLYAKPMLNGVTSIYDSLYQGSAAEWLDKENKDADKYYVYKMARTKMDDNTAVIPYSTGNEQGKFYGVDNGNPVLVAFRSYLEDTGAGASYYEVVYDRVIVFHKKAEASDNKNKEADTSKDDEASYDPEEVRSQLEAKDCTVQKGKLYGFDTLKLASEGKLLTCFGNNAGSDYLILDLPNAPGQDVPNPYFSPEGMHFKLRQDEAVVVITELPDPCKYWSFIAYDMFKAQKEGRDYSKEKGFFSIGDEESGLYHTVFGSIGSPVNMLNAKHDGDSSFGTKAVIVMCANSETGDLVTESLVQAGYTESMINVMEIPADVYNMGLDKGADTFSLFGRISQPEDKKAYDDYIEGLPENATVYRVTPNKETEEAPFDPKPLKPRGSGVHEAAQVTSCTKNLDEIRKEIIDRYSDEYDYEELTTEIGIIDGLTAYTNDVNANGDVHDAAYLLSPDFKLNSDDDFVVVYGVNHKTTGKAKYFNAVLHARPMLNGVCTVFDSMVSGSADEFLPEDISKNDEFYAYKMARTELDDTTAVIPYSTGNKQGKFYGVDNDNPVFMLFRLYLDETEVGASYYELVNDRVIVFHKKR